MSLEGKKVAVLVESDYYEHEIWYYHYRFAEEGIDARFVSRLWGNPSLTFTGHEYKAPFVCDKSFEDIDDRELDTYSAVIVPSGIVTRKDRVTNGVRKARIAPIRPSLRETSPDSVRPPMISSTVPRPLEKA